MLLLKRPNSLSTNEQYKKQELRRLLHKYMKNLKWLLTYWTKVICVMEPMPQKCHQNQNTRQPMTWALYHGIVDLSNASQIWTIYKTWVKKINTHNLLQRSGQNCQACAYETFEVNFHISHCTNTNTYNHNHNRYFNLLWILLVVKNPFHHTNHGNHAQLWNLRQNHIELIR